MTNDDMIQDLSQPNVKPQHGYITLHKDTIKKQNDEAFCMGVVVGCFTLTLLHLIIRMILR